MSESVFHPIDLILRKRDGHELSTEEIGQFVQSVVNSGEKTSAPMISDAQIGSFLMAVFQRGLSARELADLTTAMRFSGETFDASGLDTFTVDKHSTGGVGDKSSLLIAPVLAAAGLENSPSISVPMICGRSLGHTGGTLDKLETIPGFKTQLPLDSHARRAGRVSRSARRPDAAPRPRRPHPLRNARPHRHRRVALPHLRQHHVEEARRRHSRPRARRQSRLRGLHAQLRASKYLVFHGSTGELAGTCTVALLTSMEEPLGRFSGNWAEVWECVDIMRGNATRCPPTSSSYRTFSRAGCSSLQVNLPHPKPEPTQRQHAAFRRRLQVVAQHRARQGGDIGVFNNPAAFHKPRATRVLKASRAGYLSAMDCKEVGWAVQRLGAGRSKPGDPVSAHAGIESHAKLGTKLEAGQPIFTLFSEDAPARRALSDVGGDRSDRRRATRASHSSARSCGSNGLLSYLLFFLAR